jgi:hypothetical protein
MTPTIAALLREREHYTRRGLPERVAAVDAELSRLGHIDPSSDKAIVDDLVDDYEAQTGKKIRPETTAAAALPETATPPRPQPRRSPRAN